MICAAFSGSVSCRGLSRQSKRLTQSNSWCLVSNRLSALACRLSCMAILSAPPGKTRVKDLFADLDRNGDGALDRAEAARAPDALRLRQLGWGYLFAVPKSAPWEQLDLYHDGRVSFAEFSEYYRRHGLGLPIVGVGQFAPTQKLNETLLKQLSHDKTSQVSRDEWARADKILAALDADQDEMIRPDEIFARTPYPGSFGGLALLPPALGQPQPRLLQELPLLSLPADRQNAGWVQEWMARKGKHNELNIASSRLSSSLGKALDRNGDGKLDEPELLAWRGAPPEVNRQIRIDKNGSTVMSAAVKDSPKDAVLSVHGDVHLIVHVVPGRLPEEWAKAKEVALQRFQQADVNHDGFVDKTESGKINYAPLRDHFPMADRDGDGKIQPGRMGELPAAARRFGRLPGSHHGIGLLPESV